MFIVNVVEGDNPTRHRHLMLWILIAANIVLFFLTWLFADHLVFFQDYGFVPAAASWITAHTSIFLHGGVLHLALNLIFLWVFGDNVEDVVGPLLFLFVFILGGVAGHFVHYYFEAASVTPLVGTSAAISAVLGVYLVFFRHVETHLILHFPGWSICEADPIRSTVLGAVSAWFVEQLILLIVTDFTSFGELIQVSVPASIAGLLVGILLGLVFTALGYMRRYSYSRNQHWLFGYVLQPTVPMNADSDTEHQRLYKKFPWIQQRQLNAKSKGERNVQQ